MKRISKTDQKRIDDLIEKIEAQRDKIVAVFETQLRELFTELNEVRQELYSVLDDLATEAESYYDERSEKWQEGDAGSAYVEFKDAIANARDGFDEEVEVPSIDDVFDSLNTALEGVKDGALPTEPTE